MQPQRDFRIGYVLRFVLAGLVFEVVAIGLWVALSKLAVWVFPSLLNSIASLLFGPIILIPIIFVSVALGIWAGYLVVKSIPVLRSWFLLICAGLLSIELTIVTKAWWPLASNTQAVTAA